MTSYGLDEWIWVMFKPTPTWPNFDFGQIFMLIGGSFEKKSEVGAKNVMKVLYFKVLTWEKKVFFAIQNLVPVDIQSSRFRWYSIVFERTQSRLVSFSFLIIEERLSVEHILIHCVEYIDIRHLYFNVDTVPPVLIISFIRRAGLLYLIWTYFI